LIFFPKVSDKEARDCGASQAEADPCRWKDQERQHGLGRHQEEQ